MASILLSAGGTTMANLPNDRGILPVVRRRKNDQLDDSVPDETAPLDAVRLGGDDSALAADLSSYDIKEVLVPLDRSSALMNVAIHKIGSIGLTEAALDSTPFVTGPEVDKTETRPVVVSPRPTIMPILLPEVGPGPVIHLRPEPLPTYFSRQQYVLPGQDTRKPHPGYKVVEPRRKQPSNLNNGGNHGTRGTRNRGRFVVR